MPTKDAVELTQEERYQLLNLTKKGKNSFRVLKRSQVLSLADQGYQDQAITQILMVGESTAQRTRQRYVEEGLSLALTERNRQGRPQKLTSQEKFFNRNSLF